ncbi:MAG: insulinase family protein, partial [Bacteroidetes bacterium]|nr:insulinase family protein [Bacteroidota bacterium]
MISYTKQKLSNGLTLIHHYDEDTTLCVLNILYKVGARNENPNKTGFAHLFEHLMFGGSKNIPSYDEPLQNVGGENNAFTNNDITNYYLTVPVANVETGFWLESDRMLELAFSEESLEVQRKVVCEEFKQRYLTQPYGDAWLKLRELAYTTHPYKWPTIGKELSHIENATLEDVKEFFYKFYAPDNAIMVVAGNIPLDKTVELTEKYFGDIPNRNVTIAPLEQEPVQTEPRRLVVKSKVPLKAIYIAWHIVARTHQDYQTSDLISDILSGGQSGRLYLSLVKEKQIFTDINAYITGDIDPGLMVIEGRLNPDITFEQAEQAIYEVLNDLKGSLISNKELTKVKNKAKTIVAFAET